MRPHGCSTCGKHPGSVVVRRVRLNPLLQQLEQDDSGSAMSEESCKPRQNDARHAVAASQLEVGLEPTCAQLPPYMANEWESRRGRGTDYTKIHLISPGYDRGQGESA